jgi:hypothetical protein
MAGLYPQPKQPRNPFDQFDEKPEVNPFDQFDEKPEVNPFDQFDGLSKPPSIFQPKNAGGLFAQGALDQGAGSMAEGGLRLADTLGRNVLGELDAPDLVSARRGLERAEDTLRAVSRGRMKADPGYEVIRDRARAEVARLTPAQQPALDAIAAKPGLIPAAKKVGEFRQAVREVYPVDAEVQESIPGQVVQGVGQALGGIPLFLTGLGLPASAAQLFDQGYQEATQSGADLETAAAAGLANVPAAVLEQVGDKFQLGSMVKALRGNAKGAKQIVKTALNAFAGEAGTEALQQGHQNAVAQALYDKDRQLTEGMGTAALVGGLTGATVATGATALGEGIAALDTRKNLAETTATLAAQQEQLLAGRRPAQMFPVDAQGKVTNELPLPEGMKRLETERGVFHYNPQQITADEIFSASAQGAENRALALGSTSKPEAEAAAQANNEPLVTITERTPQGTEVRSSVINRSAAKKTQAEMQPGLTPGNRLTIETPEQTLAGRQPDFLADILQKDAQALAARQAADAKEKTAREQRQRDLDAKKENVGEAMQLGDAVLQDQAATFAEVQGALKRVQFYAENNALGITQDQRIAAQRQQARLAQRLAALEPAEMARRDLENQKRLADDAAALAAQKAQRTQARQEFKQEEKAGRDATGALDYTRMSEDDLVTRAQAGDAKAEKVLMQRADQQGDDRPTLLDVLARVKLPGTDAALGGELKLLAEGMTPQQRRQLIATKETGLDTVAEVLRADHGFSQIQTPADVLDFVERALRGEDIRPDRTGEGQVEFATSEPIVLWHAARGPAFKNFDMSKARDGAHFFATDPSHAAFFGNAKPYAVQINNPKTISQTDLETRWDERVNDEGESGVLPRDMVKSFVEDAKAEGFDGLIIKDFADVDQVSDVVLPFSPKQITPATDEQLAGPPNKNAARPAPTTRPVRSREEIGTPRPASNFGPEFATSKTTTPAGPADPAPRTDFRDAEEQRAYLRNPDNFNDRPFPGVVGGTPLWKANKALAEKSLELDTERRRRKLSFDEIETIAQRATGRSWPDFQDVADYDRTLAELRNPGSQVGKFPGGQTEIEFATIQDTFDLGGTPVGIDLPNAVRNLTPRWQEKTLAFESSLDKALYYAGGTNSETRDLVASRLAQQTGLTTGQIATLARQLRDRIAPLTRSAATTGTIRVPAQMRSEVAAITGIDFATAATEGSAADETRGQISETGPAGPQGQPDLPPSARDSDRNAPAQTTAQGRARGTGRGLDPQTSFPGVPATPEALRTRSLAEIESIIKRGGIDRDRAAAALRAYDLRLTQAREAKGAAFTSRPSPIPDEAAAERLVAAIEKFDAGGKFVWPAGLENLNRTTRYATGTNKANAPAPEPTDNATIEREWTALVRAFPRLAELFKLRIGSIQSEFNEAGYRGQVPSNVEAAVWGQKRLIVVAARAWRDRNNGAALLTHEVAHLFWDTLPADAKAQLRALHAKETGTKTGPLYTAQGFMRGSIQFERDRLPVARVAADPELPVKEWFAERIAIINKAWAEGRLDRTETPLLRRLADELRQLWRRIVEAFATRSNLDPDSELFEAQFRAFILAGADVQIGRNAGTSYAQKKAQFAQRPSFATGDQTNTPEFKAWFGDSKIVDAAGKPLVVHHASNGKFDTFEMERSTGVAGSGGYFTEAAVDSRYGENIISAFLSIKNPIDLRGGDRVIFGKQRELLGRTMQTARSMPEIKEIANDFRRALMAQGYDGVIMDAEPLPGVAGGSRYFVAFNPTQIKSATGNRGTFDPANPRIDFATANRGLSWQRFQEWSEQFPTFAEWNDRVMNTPGRLIVGRPKNGQNYELRLVPVASIKPNQSGDDYLNDSSRETARRIKAGTVVEARPADLAPILLEKDGRTLLDGNHRHAAATLNGDREILAIVPIGPGTGQVVNLREFYDQNLAGPDFASSEEMFTTSEMEGDGDQVTYPPTPDDVVEKLEDTLLFRFLGNKSALANKLGGLIKVGVKDVILIGDMMAGAGYYGNLLAKLGLGAEIPRIHNEWETMRAITFSALKTNPAETIAADEAWQARFKDIQAAIDRDNPTLDVNERLKLKHRAIDAAARAVIEPLLPAGSADPDRKTPIVIAATPNLAGLNLALQNLTPNPITFSFSKEDGKLKPLVTKIQERAAYRKGESGRKLLAEYSKHLQFTEVTQSDGYATLTEKAAPNTFFFLDPGYSGDSSNYDSVLDWQTSRAAFQNLLSTTVHDAWRNGAKLFITNNWDQGTALHLRRLGFTVIKETRASGDPELIAINYDSQTGRLIPWTQPINSAGEAGTRPNQAPQRPGRNDAAQRPEPVAEETPQADGGNPRRTNGQLQARQIELPSADPSREVSPDLQGRLVDGSAAREARLQQIRDELDQLQNSQEDQAEINARGQALNNERDRLQAEQRAEQRERQVESSIIDVRHPAAVGTPEPGEAWMMVPRMTDAQLRQERMDVGQHLVDNYQDLGRAGRSLLNARIDAIRAEEARRAPQPRRDAEGNALVDPIPKTSRRDALIAELQRGRAMAGEANRTGNDEALKEGTRLVRLAKERLDEEFPGWETAARPTTAQAPSAAPDATDTQPGAFSANTTTPPPRPPAPPIAEAAQPDDAEPSPFTGENEPSEPIRKGKIAEVYGHSSYQPGVVVRTWRKVRDTLVGIRGPIPELPAFPGSALNAADRFIKEKGPQFYNGLREFYRALKSGNDYIQRTAEEQVARITRPLIEAGGKFSADDYAKLQTRQEQARRLRAEGKIVPPGALAEITALQSKMEGNPYVLFNRLVLMLDLKWRHENLKDSRGNPIALPSSLNRTEVNTELARLGNTIQNSDHAALIRTALDRHMQLVKDVAADLQSRELMAAEQLANPYYFPHLTLEIKRGDKTEQRELTPTRVRPGTEADFRGYLQDPVGSRKPIETDYVRALYYHLVQVGAHNLKADAVAQYARPYDVMAEVRARAEQLSRTRGESVSWEQAFNEEFEPAGYVRYGTDSRDAFPTIMVDRDKLARRLGRELTSEDLQQQLARLGMDGVRLMPEDLKETLMAGNRETWIVPARVAEGLRGIADRETRTSGEIDAAMKWALGKWKAWKLFMPWNHIRYEYGNVVADVEKIFSATPGTFKSMPEAAREIRAFWLGGEPSADLRAALKDGVINSITAQEMSGLVRLRAFKEFESTAEKVWNTIKRRGSSALLQPIAAPLGLGDFSSPELSAFREAVFRYANFKHNLGRLRAGERPDYGGAYNRDIDAMQDSKPGANDRAQRQAGQISKATFGDYGDISVLGQTMRDKLIPFYSWMEVNFKYHANLFRNLRDMVRANEVSKIEAAGKGARAAATFAAGFGARAAGGFVLRLALPYVAVALWNGGLGAVAGAWDEDDEIEKELSEEDRRRFHIILGRNADGTVNIVYGQTALIDIMKWFSGANFMQQAGSYLNGKTDFPTALAEWRDNLVPDFLNNTVGSFGPYAKIPVTLATKKNPFPDVTDMRTVPAYDMRRVIIGQIADDFTADQIERIVSKDYYAARDFGTWAKQLVLQVRQRDPEAWAFYAIKDKAAEFVERQTGTKRESSYDAPDQQVLRNFRRAIYRGDVEKATQFYQRLLDYGYTADRFKQSIRAQEPLAGLPKENGLRAAFVAGLTPDERRLLDRAQSYYTRINSQRGEERGLFPSDRSGAAGLQRFQANPQVDRLRQTMERNQQLDDDARRLQAERALQNSLKNTR